MAGRSAGPFQPTFPQICLANLQDSESPGAPIASPWRSGAAGGPGIFPPGSEAIGSDVPRGMPFANRLCPDENLLRQNASI
ncbi:hypothetical protein ELI54_15700 [Rhizobium ruizarguesonis]|nr:hypothetical protein ELI56_15785 [Rhizobium ruizarguesonis]TAT89543.1 hypothetical protein ELI54_15700 [Rhizobium ruizarguesonis]TAY80293.1 hypothetical protein ELH86_15685 [Rhizobium ruizarguesonis]TAZ35984.1 hypothetical protein ELH80_17275 [Rhizobium ruizarguesonis]TAZ74081.1 hypothetical protein ELH70_16180 [Rhizobium ruizarguesonis]